MPVLLKRDCWTDRYGNQRCSASPWNDWVRWLVIVIIVVICFLLFVFCSCLTARRRRRAGRNPMWGTGWAARNGHGEPQYYPPQQQQPYYNPQYAPPPAPPYSPPSGGYYANQPNGSYETGTTMTPQPPQAAYTHPSRDADNVYAPPPGPPPGK